MSRTFDKVRLTTPRKSSSGFELTCGPEQRDANVTSAGPSADDRQSERHRLPI